MRRLRLLLDQMLDQEVAQALADLDHDALRVSDVGLASAADDVILQRAIADGRLLVTLDGHFGDWAILPLSAHSGVIRVKASPTTTRNILAVLLPFLDKTADRDFRNQLVIVRPAGARWIRTCPEPPPSPAPSSARP